MDFSSQRYADVIVATPIGRIDHAAARALESALLPLVGAAGDGSAGTVLDFTRVDYISSVGLRVLMVAAKQSRARSKRIAVAGLSSVVAEIFAISRFDAVLDVHPSLGAALQSVSPAAFAAYVAAGRGATP
jgi:anti-anti-sigma factor